jgi:hypothetical protein
MTNDNFCFYLQNRLIQTSQTGGHWYSDSSPFSIPWLRVQVQPQLARGETNNKESLFKPGVDVIKLLTAVIYEFL